MLEPISRQPRPLLAAKFHSDRFEPGELREEKKLRGDDVWVDHMIYIPIR